MCWQWNIWYCSNTVGVTGSCRQKWHYYMFAQSLFRVCRLQVFVSKLLRGLTSSFLQKTNLLIIFAYPVLCHRAVHKLEKYLQKVCLFQFFLFHPVLFPACWWVTATLLLVFCWWHTHTRLTAPFPELPGWAGTRKVKPMWILLKQETVSGSGISWATCKSAPRSRQITTPAPHHSVFYRPDALPATRSTVSKHWRPVLVDDMLMTHVTLKWVAEAYWKNSVWYRHGDGLCWGDSLCVSFLILHGSFVTWPMENIYRQFSLQTCFICSLKWFLHLIYF